jgi:glutathione peroxidase
LKDNSFTFFGKKVKWNFTKFLVNKDWSKIKRFAPVTKPEKLEKQIIALLQK